MGSTYNSSECGEILQFSLCYGRGRERWSLTKFKAERDNYEADEKFYDSLYYGEKKKERTDWMKLHVNLCFCGNYRDTEVDQVKKLEANLNKYSSSVNEVQQWRRGMHDESLGQDQLVQPSWSSEAVKLRIMRIEM